MSLCDPDVEHMRMHVHVCKVVAILRGTVVATLQRTDDMRGDGLRLG